MKWIRLLLMFAGGLVVMVGGGGAAVLCSKQLPAPPFQFNHPQHFDRMFGGTDAKPISKEAMADLVQNPRLCENCHVGVLKRRQAGRPEIWICARCHEDEAQRRAGGEDTNATPLKIKLLERIKKDEAFNWTPVFDVEGHVYFSHERHVGYRRSTAAPATLNFSHPVHLAEDLECLDCHEDSGERAVKLPTEEVCSECHSEADPDDPEKNCALCHFSAKPAPIKARFNSFPEVTFSHATHLKAETIECVDCHAGIPKNETITTASAPTMDTCVDCHRARDVPATCVTCHEKPPTRTGELSVACAECHGAVAESESLPTRSDSFSMTWCLDCHKKESNTTDCMSCHR